jgi:ABC-type phosphate transport system substrate-binding protein
VSGCVTGNLQLGNSLEIPVSYGGRHDDSRQVGNGAGATFPSPISSKWFSEYNTLHPDVRINYQPIGAGGGVRQKEISALGKIGIS